MYEPALNGAAPRNDPSPKGAALLFDWLIAGAALAPAIIGGCFPSPQRQAFAGVGVFVGLIVWTFPLALLMGRLLKAQKDKCHD